MQSKIVYVHLLRISYLKSYECKNACMEMYERKWHTWIVYNESMDIYGEHPRIPKSHLIATSPNLPIYCCISTSTTSTLGGEAGRPSIRAMNPGNSFLDSLNWMVSWYSSQEKWKQIHSKLMGWSQIGDVDACWCWVSDWSIVATSSQPARCAWGCRRSRLRVSTCNLCPWWGFRADNQLWWTPNYLPL